MPINPPLPRLATGIAGLDEILGGGLLPGRTVLVKGAPGTGKTTLGMQMLIGGARDHGEPGILLTFEQSPEQLHADAANFGWDLRDLIERGLLHVIYVSPEQILETQARQANGVLVAVSDWVDDHDARRVLIDSISHLGPIFAEDNARARFMHFTHQLRQMGLTPILTAELTPSVGLAGLDAYLVDTLLHVELARGGRRSVETLKHRGSGFAAGAHPFEFTPDGIRIFPRVGASSRHGETPKPVVTPEPSAGQPPQPQAKLTSGVAGLDPLLAGGYLGQSVVMVAGLSGTLKSTLALQFLLNPEVTPEAPGILLAFNEDASQLRYHCAALEQRPAGSLIVLHPAAGDPVEKFCVELEELVGRTRANRLVIDDMNTLLGAYETDAARAAALRWLLGRLKSIGVATLLTQRLDHVSGPNPLAEIRAADMADTIIYLGLVEIESRLEKVLSVLKHRGGQTSGDLRALACTSAGLTVRDRFVGLSGVLAGSPLGRRKAQIEEIFQPLYFIRDFLALTRDESLDPARRQALLQSLAGETDRLIGLLGSYFDQPLAGNNKPKGGGDS